MGCRYHDVRAFPVEKGVKPALNQKEKQCLAWDRAAAERVLGV
jgi:hypothetical protein